MSGKTTKIALAELVEDMDLYPRHAVDGQYVAQLVDALAAGAELPPIVADAASKRITDGLHRARALRRFLGPDAETEVVFVRYRNEREMVLDAVQRNSRHGRKLDGMDRSRSVIMLRTVGCDDDEIASALSVPEKTVVKLAVRVATASKSAEGAVPGTSTITLKGSTRHLSGTKLSKRQAEACAMMPGTSFALLARQLAVGLREGLVDLSDEPTTKWLVELAEVLAEKLPVPVA